MKKTAPLLAVVLLTTLQTPSLARNNVPSLVLTQCQACHGLNGVSALPGAPHLAGQPADYLVRQLRAYRSGERQNEQMSVVSKALSDADIDAISDWYSRIPFKVEEVTAN